MTHPLIDQLRFTRREWLAGLDGISEEDGARHLGRMNCISWDIGHLAWQEQRYCLQRPQGIILYPQLNELFAYGAPMNTPSFMEMIGIWRSVTEAGEPFLDSLTGKKLLEPLLLEAKDVGQPLGSALQRMTYHYWYHIGEIQAIRQVLDHSGLPEYVGDIEGLAPFRV